MRVPLLSLELCIRGSNSNREIVVQYLCFFFVFLCVSGHRSHVDFEQMSRENIIKGKRKDLWHNTYH
jgi:hypothetical protein